MDVRFRGDDGGVGRGTGYRYVAPSGQLDIINDVRTKKKWIPAFAGMTGSSR